MLQLFHNDGSFFFIRGWEIRTSQNVLSIRVDATEKEILRISETKTFSSMDNEEIKEYTYVSTYWKRNQGEEDEEEMWRNKKY